MNMSKLSIKNISKQFPGVKALDSVSLNAYAGEAMALMGENGAGKSTLIKILAGIYTRDEGNIFIDGKEADIKTVKDSQKYKIAIIHQELNLIPNLTVAENIFIGREPVKKFNIVDKEKMIKGAGQYLQELGVTISPESLVSELSIAAQQMVEIAKAISENAEIIVMDEPTDALTDKEVETLFKVIRSLKKQNKAIIYISHRIGEIFEICERTTILRDGQLIGEREISNLTEDEVIQMMVGRSLTEQFPYVKVESEEVILEVEELCNEFFENISFQLKKGEVLGIAGLVGSGRTELAKTIYGTHVAKRGNIRMYGKSIDCHKVFSGLEHGIAYVSEDRKKDGLVLSMSVKENMSLSSMKIFRTIFGVNKKKEVEYSEHFKKKMNIKTPNMEQKIKNLSGGNQQKVSIAKCLMTEPDVLILDEPTRGIDVGAKYEIYELINQMKKEEKGIIVISSEMPELLGISDRIIIMHEGRKKGELLRDEFSQEKIMQYILS